MRPKGKSLTDLEIRRRLAMKLLELGLSQHDVALQVLDALVCSVPETGYGLFSTCVTMAFKAHRRAPKGTPRLPIALRIRRRPQALLRVTSIPRTQIRLPRRPRASHGRFCKVVRKACTCRRSASFNARPVLEMRSRVLATRVGCQTPLGLEGRVHVWILPSS